MGIVAPSGTIPVDSELKKRATLLKDAGLNGLHLLLVQIDPPPPAPAQRALVDLYFHNTIDVAAIAAATAVGGAQRPKDVFPISGGHKLLAGGATDQVQVTAVDTIAGEPNALRLTIAPVGDYSTYMQRIDWPTIDPIFNEIDFKFRPACFSIDCAPEWDPGPLPKTNPPIDYLAKDYDSFRHAIITAMQQRVPGWVPTSEADLSQVLIDQLSAAADELSDYQDRVMNEAYLASARKRLSLARHARLMDYHIYQGNQSSTWVALEVAAPATLAPGFDPSSNPPFDPTTNSPGMGFGVWAGPSKRDPSSVLFASIAPRYVDPDVNDLGLYTWSDTQPALGAGDTSADLITLPPAAALDQAGADALRDLFAGSDPTKQITHLLIQEHLNPATGGVADFDPTHRQLVQIIDGQDPADVARAPVALQDPLTKAWFVRVSWRAQDALTRDYCFTVQPVEGGPKATNVSRFHGNLVPVRQGRLVEAFFVGDESQLKPDDDRYHLYTSSLRWTLCALPPDRPVLYSLTAPRGETPTRSTAWVEVKTPSEDEQWREEVSLIHATSADPVFAVETDELGASVIRFGDGENGRALPIDDQAVVHVYYSSGRGIDGNVGHDKITGASDPTVLQCWNPFDVTDGADPEPPEQIVRNVPEAYRFRQLRAITLADYVKRAEELPEVQRASAAYAWTGSWRTVRVTIDPVGSETLDDDLRRKLLDSLDSVRLLGEDIELRPPEFVPLQIQVSVCVDAAFWIEDLRFVLEQEFSTGYTPDGRPGFFNPNQWTFGRVLYASEIEGRVQQVQGVGHIVSLSVKRWNAATPGAPDFTEVGPTEIIQVHNDPDHMELGSIDFDFVGGRS